MSLFQTKIMLEEHFISSAKKLIKVSIYDPTKYLTKVFVVNATNDVEDIIIEEYNVYKFHIMPFLKNEFVNGSILCLSLINTKSLYLNGFFKNFEESENELTILSSLIQSKTIGYLDFNILIDNSLSFQESFSNEDSQFDFSKYYNYSNNDGLIREERWDDQIVWMHQEKDDYWGEKLNFVSEKINRTFAIKEKKSFNDFKKMMQKVLKSFNGDTIVHISDNFMSYYEQDVATKIQEFLLDTKKIFVLISPNSMVKYNLKEIGKKNAELVYHFNEKNEIKMLSYEWLEKEKEKLENEKLKKLAAEKASSYHTNFYFALSLGYYVCRLEVLKEKKLIKDYMYSCFDIQQLCTELLEKSNAFIAADAKENNIEQYYIKPIFFGRKEYIKLLRKDDFFKGVDFVNFSYDQVAVSKMLKLNGCDLKDFAHIKNNDLSVEYKLVAKNEDRLEARKIQLINEKKKKKAKKKKELSPCELKLKSLKQSDSGHIFVTIYVEDEALNDTLSLQVITSEYSKNGKLVYSYKGFNVVSKNDVLSSPDNFLSSIKGSMKHIRKSKAVEVCFITDDIDFKFDKFKQLFVELNELQFVKGEALFNVYKKTNMSNELQMAVHTYIKNIQNLSDDKYELKASHVMKKDQVYVYSDASFLKNKNLKKFGFGLVFVKNGTIKKEVMGSSSSSYKVSADTAEYNSIVEVLKMIRNLKIDGVMAENEKIEIRSDNLNAIRFLDSGLNKKLLHDKAELHAIYDLDIIKVQSLLQKPELKDLISFRWLKGHANEKFNERVDELAKKARVLMEEGQIFESEKFFLPTAV